MWINSSATALNEIGLADTCGLLSAHMQEQIRTQLTNTAYIYSVLGFMCGVAAAIVIIKYGFKWK